MTIKTKHVQGRRALRYANCDELLADAEAIAGNAQNVKNLGNWSVGQVFQHLSKSLNLSIDGSDFKAPWVFRIMGKLFMKKKFIYKGMPAGFTLPASAAKIFLPADRVEAVAAVEELRAALERVKTDSTRALHGLLGTLTKDEWDNFSLRHAELHMSFLVPPDA